jgi:hypothetical protein
MIVKTGTGRSGEFNAHVMPDLEWDLTVAEVSWRHSEHPNLLYRWAGQPRPSQERPLAGNTWITLPDWLGHCAVSSWSAWFGHRLWKTTCLKALPRGGYSMLIYRTMQHGMPSLLTKRICNLATMQRRTQYPHRSPRAS